MSRILACYYRPKPGGFCKRLFRALSALLERGHEVHYLAVEPFPIQHINCHFHRFWWPFRRAEGVAFWLCFHLLVPWLLMSMVIRLRIDRLLAFGANYAALMQPAALLFRRPLTFFVRADQPNNDLLRFRSPWIGRIGAWLEGVGMYRADVLAVSEALQTQLVKRHLGLRVSTIAVLPNEIPRVAVVPREPAIDGMIRLACVGMLEHIKNQQFLLRALSELRSLPWQLHIYGVGPDEDALRRLVFDLRLEPRVVFCGWQRPEQLWPCTDLLLFPSLSEGSPNAVLEALAYQVPVLASDIAANREILGDVGVLSLADLNCWRENLARMILDVEQRIQLQAAQERVTSALRFDWNEQICRQVVQLRNHRGLRLGQFS